ncbi:MAG: hypothetical protein ACK5B9_04755 [Flavobacteriia bacterium]
MSSENIYRTKEDPSDSNRNEAPKTTKKKASDGPKATLKNPIAGISSRFDRKKTRTIIGAIFILLSFYFFFACLSYIFTWKQDQDRVIEKGLFKFLFEAK